MKRFSLSNKECVIRIFVKEEEFPDKQDFYTGGCYHTLDLNGEKSNFGIWCQKEKNFMNDLIIQAPEDLRGGQAGHMSSSHYQLLYFNSNFGVSEFNIY